MATCYDGCVAGAVIVVRRSGSADELVQTLRACGAAVRVATSVEQVLFQLRKAPADAVLLDLEEDGAALADLAAALPVAIRLIAIGDPRSITMAAGTTPPECVLLAQPDEATLRCVLAAVPPV